MIKYDRYWFNPVYYHIEKYSQDPNVRHIFVYGGKSSSKTFSITQLFPIKVLSDGFSVLMFRKEATKIKYSLKRAVRKILRSIGIIDTFDVLDFEFRCKQYDNQQAVIMMRGFEDEEAVKGIEDFKWILLDELNNYTEDEFNQADASLRGQSGQKVFATWNPISEDHWIKRSWIDTKVWNDASLSAYPKGHKLHYVSTLSNHSRVQISKDGMSVLIKTNFYDNKWIFGGNDNGVIYGDKDENLIKLYENYKYSDPYFYNVNVLGNWGIVSAEDPFIYNLDYNKNLGKCRHLYDPSLPVYCSLDFNKRWTALIKQIQGDKIYYLKCYHDYPEVMMEKIAIEFGGWEMYFTGDFSGNSQTQYVSDTSKKTAWQLARNYYNDACCRVWKRDKGMQERAFANFKAVPNSGNTGYANSRTITNALLYLWRDRLMIDEDECRMLIADCQRIEATPQGGLNKEELNRKNIGHWLDVFRYDHAYFHYQDYLKIGK